MNVFDELRELERTGSSFDTIVLDPPAFAKNKASVAKAIAGYKEINLRALKLLRPGGFLITCSCSYNIGEAAFLDVVSSAAIDARAEMALVEKRTQGTRSPDSDHRSGDVLPEVPHSPEAGVGSKTEGRGSGSGQSSVQGQPDANAWHRCCAWL